MHSRLSLPSLAALRLLSTAPSVCSPVLGIKAELLKL